MTEQLNLFGLTAEKEPRNTAVKGGVEKARLRQLQLSVLEPDPEQPRKYFDPEALAELQASITVHGVLQPILVRPGGERGFIIVSGERRFLAARLAGLTIIPALLTDGNPAEIAIIENLLRENLTAIEEAEAIGRLQTFRGYQLSELSGVLGKAVATLSEILSLNRLPDDVKDDCRKDPKTSRGVLVEIAREREPSRMTSLYRKYKEMGLTRGEIRKHKVKAKGGKAPVNLDFISACAEKIYNLELTDLDEEKLGMLKLELEKLRTVTSHKLKKIRS